MNLAEHKGILFCGMATSFERDRHSRSSSYIYAKKSSDSPWELEADFGPRTSRVGALYSARFVNDASGKPIPDGPVDVLVAFTMKLEGAGQSSLQARIRNDDTDKWLTVDLPVQGASKPNVRDAYLHRDSVTGADLLFVAANPSPLGLITGVYNANAPGGIRWSSEPEITARARRGTSKWFGMAVVNGILLASDANIVYRRIDGAKPEWVEVLEFPRAGDEGGAEVRGLTAVPNLKNSTGWSENQMLIFATQFNLWRMRVPATAKAPHPNESELDMRPWLNERLGSSVVFAEAAFNQLRFFQPLEKWPIGFQVVFEVPGKTLSNKDPASYRLEPNAWFLLRDIDANYELQEITSNKRLFLARDFEPSPFPGEQDILYACGYNGSYWKGSLGSAWIYQGTLQSSKVVEK